ncbi:MAG: RrF2 family transcriptional regulator [Candidatus Odinarchaeota archaeon]
MKIFSEKIKYGLAALFELAKNYTKGPIKIEDIATLQNIPQNYLEHLLIILKNADLVKSVRGKNGGYQLKRPANSITVLDLLRGLEGKISTFERYGTSDVLKYYWKGIEKQFKELFHTTLEDLINEENKINNRLFFQI